MTEIEPITEDGWIAWSGGECPVPAGTRTSVRLLSGDEFTDDEPEGWYWGGKIGAYGIGTANHIVAYRIAPPVPDTPEVAALKAEIAALKTRAMPEARRYTTAEMESLPNGFYLAWLRRMKAWSVFVRVGGEWIWHGDEIAEPEAEMAQSWIAGPLSLPTPPEEIETPDISPRRDNCRNREADR